MLAFGSLHIVNANVYFFFLLVTVISISKILRFTLMPILRLSGRGGKCSKEFFSNFNRIPGGLIKMLTAIW